MDSTLTEQDWEILLARISSDQCTPFLGAGVHEGALPLGGTLAKEWAKKYAYPLADSNDLARVSQYVAIKYGEAPYVKSELASVFERVELPPQEDTAAPLAVLSDLPLSIFMTTNYDLLIQGMLARMNKSPRHELCRWNSALRRQPDIFDSEGFVPTPSNPLVYHLHGHHASPDSLVLTEDDYLDFLVNFNRYDDFLPLRISEALSGTSLLFIGYRLADWTFRILFRALLTSLEAGLQRVSVAVQIPPSDEAAKDYLTKYFANFPGKVRVYLGDARTFTSELRKRWEQART